LFSRQDAKLAKAPPPNHFSSQPFTSISPSLAHFAPLRENSLLSLPPYVLIALAISSLPRSMRPATTENTIFIGIMMPLKARMGTVTSVPAK
jgi:hypothetical protein